MLATSEMELTFAAYQARQQHEISRAGLVARAESVRPGGRFRRAAGLWRPEPYRGYAVVTMLACDPANAALTEALLDVQRELALGLDRSDALYLLPASSFHQTIANTLSAERFDELVVQRGVQAEFAPSLGRVLGVLPVPSNGAGTITMRMIGVSIFSTAIGLLGVFEEEADFERVLACRDHFYGHELTAQLGVRRTRPFIGHVTLGYVENVLDADARGRLVAVTDGINRALAGRELHFHLPFCELRAYEHLAEFRSLPGLATARL